MVALSCIGMMSCEKEIKVYDGLEGVYFNVQWGAPWGDTTVWANQSFTPVEFVNVTGDTYDVKVRVQTTGQIKDYDRTFRMVADKDSTTAVVDLNYEPFDEMQIVKAGMGYTDVIIHLKRNENIKKEERLLVLKLIPTDDFVIGISKWDYDEHSPFWASEGGFGFDLSKHKIKMNDFLVRPSRWIPSKDYVDGETEGGLWGAFSEKKYNMICERFQLTYEDFLSEETMPDAMRTSIRDYFVSLLQPLYDKGTPILEDDGRAMWFMGCSWSSIIGVPWVPASGN